MSNRPTAKRKSGTKPGTGASAKKSRQGSIESSFQRSNGRSQTHSSRDAAIVVHDIDDEIPTSDFGSKSGNEPTPTSSKNTSNSTTNVVASGAAEHVQWHIEMFQRKCLDLCISDPVHAIKTSALCSAADTVTLHMPFCAHLLVCEVEHGCSCNCVIVCTGCHRVTSVANAGCI